MGHKNRSGLSSKQAGISGASPVKEAIDVLRAQENTNRWDTLKLLARAMTRTVYHPPAQDGPVMPLLEAPGRPNHV
jgi:hypothetical protein